MKNLWTELNLSLLSTGILLLFFAWFDPLFSPALFLPLCFLFQLLLRFSGEKGLRPHLAAALFFVHLLPVLFCLLTKKPLAALLPFYKLLLSCLVTSLLCYVIRSSLLLKGILLALSFFMLVYFSIAYISLPKWGIWLLLFACLFFMAEVNEQNRNDQTKRPIGTLFPFLLCAMLIIRFLPVSDDPIGWQGIKNAIRFVDERFHALLVDMQYLFDNPSGDFSLENVGFDPDGSLGGTLFSGDDTQITLEGTMTYSSLYLTGSIYSAYNGKAWAKSSVKRPDTLEEYKISQSELTDAFKASIFSDREAMQFVHPCTYTVTYKGMKTKNLFYPPHTKNLSLPGSEKTEAGTYDNLMLKKAKGYGFSYRFLSWELNYQNEQLIALLRQQAWKTSVPPLTDPSRLSYINTTYTALPETVPERVYALAQKLTASCETDYDKLKAIEDYLRKLPYTTSPDTCPGDRDFVDYFLFDSPKGYCTYFATAMAVLGRCVGIPTRYVEGYCIADTRSYHNRVLSLTGEHAHAWTEAYIQGVGFIPFEPTPGFYENAYSLWPGTVKKTASTANKKANSTAPESSMPVKEEPSLPSPLPERVLSPMIFKYSVLIVSVLFLLLFFFRIRLLLRRRSYEKKESYQKILELMQRIFSLCRRLGCERSESETLAAFSIRLNHKADTAVMSFYEVCTLFSAIRFGSHEVDTISLKSMEAYTRSLEANYLKSCGLLRRTLYRIISL